MWRMHFCLRELSLRSLRHLEVLRSEKTCVNPLPTCFGVYFFIYQMKKIEIFEKKFGKKLKFSSYDRRKLVGNRQTSTLKFF